MFLSSSKERQKENLFSRFVYVHRTSGPPEIRDIVAYDKNADATLYTNYTKILELEREEYIRIVGFISIDGNPRDSQFSRRLEASSLAFPRPPFVSSF